MVNQAAGRTLLVVDDSAGVRRVVQRLLEAEGFTVVGVGDGASALAELTRLPDLALILSDMNMPGMNGLELLSYLKKSETHAHVPALMMTALDDPSAVAHARAAGAVGWVQKPFAKGLLVAAVYKILGLTPP